jgi:hypothetical protein
MPKKLHLKISYDVMLDFKIYLCQKQMSQHTKKCKYIQERID